MRSQKTVAILIGALVAAVVLFVVLSGGDDEEPAATTTSGALTATDTTAAAGTDEGGDGTDQDADAGSAAGADDAGSAPDETDSEGSDDGDGGQPAFATEVPIIEVVDGKPVDGVTKWSVKSGDEINFVVDSTTQEEIHLHGYDVSRDVVANSAVQFELPADLEGVFEVELEGSGTQIAEIWVVP